MFVDFLVRFFIFIFGLCIGSFLNCVIYRIEKKESFIKGRSYCPTCKNSLSWHDLVPVLSFVILKGKCRHCKKKISIQYPLVELLTALVFLIVFSKFFPQNIIPSLVQIFDLFFLFYIVSVFIIIFIYDLKHYLIPDKVLFPAIFIALLYRIIFNFKQFLPNYFLALVISSGFFLIIYLISKGEWMGFGDVKLAVLLGLVVGFPNILAGLFLAFFFGAVVGVVLLAGKKKSLKSKIPFGPFLILGSFIALIYGMQIIDWYLNLFKF
jgi:prepilin signal peptidase PulO-like enzyme (type II secretory pathway)